MRRTNPSGYSKSIFILRLEKIWAAGYRMGKDGKSAFP